MAAEVPAKDVLCEAMEYLSKLGSNLRTRSESLREKKIRREKLNNVLAVQKAASKVLLICELSKKSLENVENGVRKVLQLVDSSQASSSDGGKKTESCKKETKETPKGSTPVYYIKYKSRKLRIKNRISFKHYNSARVNAKCLPQSMIDKYPVYYDCKLYRMRKKQDQFLKQKEIARNEKVTKKNNESIISIPDSPDGKTKASKINQTEQSIKNTDKDVSVISIPDSPEPKDKSLKRLSINSSEANTDRENDKSPKKSEKNSTKDNKTSETGCKKSLDIEKSHTKPRRSSEACKSDSESISDTKSNNKAQKTRRESTKKRKRVISDSSSNDDKTTEHDDQEKAQESDLKKIKLNEDSNDALNKENSNDSVSDSKKPIIKCVSLSKLLKPAALSMDQPQSKFKDGGGLSEKQKHIESLKKQKEIAYQDRKSEEQAKKMKEEEKYWIEKRKEVSIFKPKNFVVNIMRMPELSPEFLKKLNLKKVTQSGIIVCKINTENVNGETKNDEETPLESNSRRNSSHSFDDNALIDEANKVKNSLLNESESEDEMGSGDESKKETDVIKNALLNDSDSDSKKSDEVSQLNCQKEKEDTSSACTKSDRTQKAKKALIDDSGSESDKNESKKIKSSLKVTKAQNNKELDSDRDNSLHVSEPNSDSGEQKEGSENQIDDECGDSEKKCENIQLHKDMNLSSEKQVLSNDESDNVQQCVIEHLSESQENNEKTPEKQAPSADDEDMAKSSLLDDSPDDKTKTQNSPKLTPHSKKQQTDAKNMLLNQSSSEAEDEQLKGTLKEIKDSLLHGSDEEGKERKKSKDTSRSSSEEEIVKKIKKEKHKSQKKHKHKHKKHRNRHNSSNSSDSDNSKSSKRKVRSKK